MDFSCFKAVYNQPRDLIRMDVILTKAQETEYNYL